MKKSTELRQLDHEIKEVSEVHRLQKIELKRTSARLKDLKQKRKEVAGRKFKASKISQEQDFNRWLTLNTFEDADDDFKSDY